MSSTGPAAGGATERLPVRGAGFIDPSVLASIGNLDLLARIVVDGFVSGLHRAVFRGVSTEFAEHRPYTPGDDIRQLDWRLYARTDRLSVKTYEAETNADLVLALDISSSMTFQGSGVRKLDYARFLLASLAHLAGRQRDRIGLATFDESIVSYVPPSVRHRERVMHTLESVQPRPGGNLGRGLERIAGALVRRGIVVVVSDFYLPPEDAVRALESLHVRGHDVIAIHLVDPVERDLELGDVTAVEDLETGDRLPISPAVLRDRYQELVSRHLDELARQCGSHEIDYACFDTASPLDHLLFRYLSQRAIGRGYDERRLAQSVDAAGARCAGGARDRPLGASPRTGRPAFSVAHVSQAGAFAGSSALEGPRSVAAAAALPASARRGARVR